MKISLAIRAVSVLLVLVGQAYMINLDNQGYVNFIKLVSTSLLIGGAVAAFNSLKFLKKFAAGENIDREVVVLRLLTSIPIIFALLLLYLSFRNTIEANYIAPYILAPIYLASSTLSRPILMEGRSVSLTIASTILPWSGTILLILFFDVIGGIVPFLFYSLLLASGNIYLLMLVKRSMGQRIPLKISYEKNSLQNVTSDLSLILLQRLPVYLASNILLAPASTLFTIGVLQAISANSSFIHAKKIKLYVGKSCRKIDNLFMNILLGVTTLATLLWLYNAHWRLLISENTSSAIISLVCIPFLFLTAIFPTVGQIVLSGATTAAIHTLAIAALVLGVFLIYAYALDGSQVILAYMLSVVLMRLQYAFKINNKAEKDLLK